MDEETQAEFIQWLAQQLGVDNEDELQKQISDMGDEGIKQAYDVFQKEKQTPMNQEGGKLGYLKKLQQGGNMFVTPRGASVSDKDVAAYKGAGIDFGTKQALGSWLDSWGNDVKPMAGAQPAPTTPKTVRRYNGMLRGFENVSTDQIMREPNSVTVGQPGAWGKWDTSKFKSNITPADTVGKPLAIRQNVQQAWTQNNVTHPPQMASRANGGKLEILREAVAFKKGGKIADKGQDGKTALNVTTFTKGEDKASALGGRNEGGDPKLSALKKLKAKGKDGRTALKGNNPKGKDGKSALGGRKDGGTNEHTALNKG